MRHRATTSLLTRDDVIIVASVSCIYGIGSTENPMSRLTVYVEVGRELRRNSFLRQLVESQYIRNDFAFTRGTFRVKGRYREIFPPSEEELAIRVRFLAIWLSASPWLIYLAPRKKLYQPSLFFLRAIMPPPKKGWSIR